LMAATGSHSREADGPLVQFNVDREAIPVSVDAFEPPVDFIQQQKAIIKEHALSETAIGTKMTGTAKKRLEVADMSMQNIRETQAVCWRRGWEQRGSRT
jgi:hypothetical protein